MIITTDYNKKLAELVFYCVQYYIRKTNRKRVHGELFLIYFGSIISVVGKTTVEIIELFECRQKVP